MSLVHIASFVVQGRPERWTELCAAIRALPDVELSHENETPGKGVIVIEAEPQTLSRRIDELHALPGLVNLVFVFQQADEESALAEEIAP